MATVGRITYRTTTVFPECKYCKEYIWAHVGGRCLYSPALYQAGDRGLKLHPYDSGPVVCSAKFMGQEDYWHCIQELYNYDNCYHHPEVLLWINYLLAIGWQP